jgi:hypothetical protein
MNRRLLVEWATSDSFREAPRVVEPAALADSDFTVRVDLTGLPAGQQIFYRVRFEDLASPKGLSEPVVGRFRTPAQTRRLVSFAFSRRRGRAGLEDQHRRGRHEALRGDAAHEPGLLHPLRRPDLRRRADQGRGGARGRLYRIDLNSA